MQKRMEKKSHKEGKASLEYKLTALEKSVVKEIPSMIIGEIRAPDTEPKNRQIIPSGPFTTTIPLMESNCTAMGSGALPGQ